MHKQMTHLYNEILFCYEKEQIIGASNTLNGSQGHYGEGKKPILNVIILYYPTIYTEF